MAVIGLPGYQDFSNKGTDLGKFLSDLQSTESLNKSRDQQTKEAKDKHEEWKSPINAKSRETKTKLDTSKNEYDLKMSEIQNKIFDEDPTWAVNFLKSEQGLKLKEVVQKSTDIDLDNHLRAFGDVEAPEEYKVAYSNALKTFGVDAVDGLPSPEEVMEDPSSLNTVKMMNSMAFGTAATRRTMAAEAAKQSAINSRELLKQNRADARTNATIASRERNTTAMADLRRDLLTQKGQQDSSLEDQKTQNKLKLQEEKYRLRMDELKKKAGLSGNKGQYKVAVALGMTTKAWTETRVAPLVIGKIEEVGASLSKEQRNQLISWASGQAIAAWNENMSEIGDSEDPNIMVEGFVDAALSSYKSGGSMPWSKGSIDLPNKAGQQSQPTGKIKVKNPDGKVGYIKESQLEEAIKQGYKKVD